MSEWDDPRRRAEEGLNDVPTGGTTPRFAGIMTGLLDANRVFLRKATTPTRTPPAPDDTLFLAQCMAAHYAGAAAWLLDHIPAGQREQVASELAELLADGEPLADWCGDQWDTYSISEDA